MRFFAGLAALFLASCGGDARPPLTASDVLVTERIAGMNMRAAYMSLANSTNQTIVISRVASPQFDSAALHESTLVEGVARMRPLRELSIPAGATVTLQQGGKHIMLMSPTGPADKVSLMFYSGDTLVLSVDAASGSISNR